MVLFTENYLKSSDKEMIGNTLSHLYLKEICDILTSKSPECDNKYTLLLQIGERSVNNDKDNLT